MIAVTPGAPPDVGAGVCAVCSCTRPAGSRSSSSVVCATVNPTTAPVASTHRLQGAHPDYCALLAGTAQPPSCRGAARSPCRGSHQLQHAVPAAGTALWAAAVSSWTHSWVQAADCADLPVCPTARMLKPVRRITQLARAGAREVEKASSRLLQPSATKQVHMHAASLKARTD